MAKFKTWAVTVSNDAEMVLTEKIDVMIDVSGHFYAYLPVIYMESFGLTGGSHCVDLSKDKSKFKISFKSFEEMENVVKEKLKIYLSPEVIEENVIVYNIESHCAFATDENSNIFPNASWPNARWPNSSWKSEISNMHGKHHAAYPCAGGYSLKIGACAMTKKTIKYGEKSKISYSYYYGGGSHHEHDNPANQLNSWSAMGVYGGDGFKEMPYSDKAALFFHEMIMSMVKLSHLVMANTNDLDKLNQLIEKETKLIA